MGVATHPTGSFVMTTYSGSFKCVQNVNSNCGVSGRVHGVLYDVLGNVVTFAELWSVIGEKGNDGTLENLTLGQRIVPISFDDQTFACLVTTTSNGTLPTTPPKGDIYLYPLAPDLSSGDPVLLIADDDMADTFYDAARIADTEDLMVIWVSADRGELQAQRFDRYGNPLGETTVVAVAGEGENLGLVRLVAQPGGDLAVAWNLEDGEDIDVRLAIFQPDGTPVTEAPVEVNTQSTGVQTLGDLDTFPDGSLVLVFDDSNGDVSGWAVQSRRFDAGGEPVAPVERVNVIQDGDQRLGTVQVLGSSEYLVAFQGDDEAVWTRRFTKPGFPAIGSLEVQIATEETGDQE